MRKDITPEMYNYNKYPGPVFVSFDNQVKSDDVVFTIVKSTSETFDAESFTQRFSEILLKYDYIVGDWGNEQLRLRGFYREDNPKQTMTAISRLDDYLKEYCNFGCAYFILENKEPRQVVFEEEQQPNRRRRPRHRRSGIDRRFEERSEQAKPAFQKKLRQTSASTSSARPEKAAVQQKGFNIRQKGERG
ncbi:YutD family protein [Streptococcus sp. E24BD]|uniref:YutD family protein n=1 Tax=Streptococcus sp. E24BD TaxID=3278715 RepID=UPI00359D3C76